MQASICSQKSTALFTNVMQWIDARYKQLYLQLYSQAFILKDSKSVTQHTHQLDLWHNTVQHASSFQHSCNCSEK